MRRIKITDKKSLVHLGSLDSFDITEGGKHAARQILSYLDSGDAEVLREAINAYEQLIPNENFGGEYTALEWLCKFWLSPQGTQTEFLAQPLVASFYELLSKDGFANLRRYINLKYHFVEIARGDDETRDYLRFMEDFILFNNPDRMRWEKTQENLEKFGIRQGMRVADVGSGPGYFSFKFGDIVGKNGMVYAIETNPRHLQFLHDHIAKYGIKNVQPVVSSFDGIGLSPDTKVDVVYMCSLYHNVYAAFTDEERDAFVGSIRRALVDNGMLIIVDNDLVADEELPYHGPYITRELIISQLWYYGFELIQHHQFTPQRYVLMFEKQPRDDSQTAHVPARFPAPDVLDEIEICSASSLIRYRIIGSSTSGYTHRGKRVAKLMYSALETGDAREFAAAEAQYQALYPTERIGDDYTALMWFCRLAQMDDADKQDALAEPITRAYYEFFSADGYDILKQYLRYKYDFAVELPDEAAQDDIVHDYTGDEIKLSLLNEWSEYLTFNNPNRHLWERTEDMLAFLNIREDEHIADIGCGSGFFSYRFAKAAPRGRVYATEINQAALHYVTDMNEKYGLNIQALTGKLNDICIPDSSVDTVFMCSMYHATYIASIEFVKDDFIKSIKRALRPGGRVVIVDNDVTPRGAPAYYGSGMAKELAISQLAYYGFRLRDMRQFVPQRYVLVFELSEEASNT